MDLERDKLLKSLDQAIEYQLSTIPSIKTIVGFLSANIWGNADEFTDKEIYETYQIKRITCTFKMIPPLEEHI